MDRDLKADLEICERMKKEVSWQAQNDFIMNAPQGWPEAIERAIKAEKELVGLKANSIIQEQIINSSRNPEDKEKIVRLAMEKSALTEENALQRASIQQLSAQVVALQEGLKYSLEQWAMYADAGQNEGYYLTEGNDSEGEKYNSIKQLLASPDPGEKYREKVAKMQRVVDNARFLLQVNQNGCMSQIGESELAKALADLEGVGKQ